MDNIHHFQAQTLDCEFIALHSFMKHSKPQNSYSINLKIIIKHLNTPHSRVVTGTLRMCKERQLLSVYKMN